jgi:hypothetical protein
LAGAATCGELLAIARPAAGPRARVRFAQFNTAIIVVAQSCGFLVLVRRYFFSSSPSHHELIRIFELR